MSNPNNGRAAVKTTVLVCFESDAGEAPVREALRLLEAGEKTDPNVRWFDEGLLAAKLSGPLAPETEGRLKRIPGVQRLAALPTGRRLGAGAFSKAESAVPLAAGASLGDGGFGVIAGPCSVEGESLLLEIAEQVKAAGAKALRGGAYKPRTSPYSWGGLCEKGLEYLVRAREKTGLPIVTEAIDLEQLDVVAKHADILQVGTRNMTNFPFLFRVGAHPAGKPILLKRGFASSIEEYLDAVEYVLLGRLLAGAERPGVILCERGIRTFETATRYTLDVASIPILQERTTLPVIADPSHAAGNRKWVPHLSKAAVAAGADGLLIEVHTDPEKAWCDADQTISTDAFRTLMEELRAIAPVPAAS
ncbi:MAG: 3-deoxy-7-phosphoheptulonate synthase [Planctomycetia bacterium]|nr:3-deoxy-7-phosphoheptulonate synthase [Planctomycetia bacterium]